MSLSKRPPAHEREVHVIEDEAKDKWLMFNCPNCDGTIVVKENETNCLIFRHGAYLQVAHPQYGQPINPHESKENVEKLVDQGIISGCGKPIMMGSDKRKVYVCGYI